MKTIIDNPIERCLILAKLEQLTAWILKYKFYLRFRARRERLKLQATVSIEELRNAEIAIIGYIQRATFPRLFLT